MLIGSAGAESAHVPQVVEQLAAMGFDGGRLTFIAVLEIVRAILFLVSSTRFLGLLLASAFLGGAIATHLQHGQPIVQPAFVLSLIWLGTWLRNPQILLEFRLFVVLILIGLALVTLMMFGKILQKLANV